jgi:hypothetical protein
MHAMIRALGYFSMALLLGSFPVIVSANSAQGVPPTVKLVNWERGIALKSQDQESMAMFLWFYEWNMFDAVEPGVHTHGSFDNKVGIEENQREAVIQSPAMRLTVDAVPDGADLSLTITNRSTRNWPDVAGIIPCFNPGRKTGTPDSWPDPANPNFADRERLRTYFLGPRGLTLLDSRAIHFSQAIRRMIDQQANRGPFPFSSKWPTSDVNAKAGLLIRESRDGKWVTAIAWEDFLSVQGNNPWDCMHLCVRVGPLAPQKRKTIRGKIYLMRGSKEDCLGRFSKDFRIE